MTSHEDTAFSLQRDGAFHDILVRIAARLDAVTPAITLHLDGKSPNDLRDNAAKDVWTLFHGGISHLRKGAPDGGPGSMAEAVARVSLRASPFAAALGVPAPHFEQILFSIDYADGRDAAFFLCRRLVEAAESDFPKSRHILQQKILDEKPALAELKEQMALSFSVLAETYLRVCGEMKDVFDEIASQDTR